MWTAISKAWAWLKAWLGGLLGRPVMLSSDKDIALIERKTFSCKVGTVVSYQVSFYSGEVVTPVVAPDSYEIFNLPPGLTYDSTTGLISGITTTVGQYGVTIQAIGPGQARQSTGVLFVIRSA
jgi:hypothetical protein